jgi:hypothetical protein
VIGCAADIRHVARNFCSAFLGLVATALVASAVSAQVNTPDLRQMSGVPLPTSDLPVGSISVRVVRGSFANNVADATVTFAVDGKTTDVRTDAAGRAEIKGLAAGSRVKASVEVDGERLETQEVTIGQSGYRFILSTGASAKSASAGTEPGPASAGQAVSGAVVLGPESRVIAQFSDDKLFIFYVLSILNSSSSPVDIGGPLTFELPQGAIGAATVEDSSPQATANGPRVVVRGPFQPGTTRVTVRFELPYSGPVARLEQKWPAPLEQLIVFALKTGDLNLRSPQLSGQRVVTEQGQLLLVASGPGMGAGETLMLDITGLPYQARWPRYVALSAAGMIVFAGLWAGLFSTGSRTRGRAA